MVGTWSDIAKTGILEFAFTILLVDTLLFHFTPITPCLSVVCILGRRCFLAHKLVFLLFDLNTNHRLISKPMIRDLQYGEWQEALLRAEEGGNLDPVGSVLCILSSADVSLASRTCSSVSHLGCIPALMYCHGYS